MHAVRGPVAVLCSGGLDSAVLLVEMARTAGASIPVFVRAGHVWEDAERTALGRFVAAAAEPRVGAIRDLALPMTDVYGPHWSMTGRGHPGWDDADETVELRGRNVVLLAKALVLAAIEGWPTVALGSLAGNPFPDATPAFFDAMAAAASRGLATPLTVVAPFLATAKADVVRRGATLPLELTLSCLSPDTDGRHCGGCNKCRERAEAFTAAAVPDRTTYARSRP
jgi:7-cyano-7-deazaguanine synthase